MPIFHSQITVWPRLQKLARKIPGRVAVAFCGKSAPRLLPLRRDSELIVDASPVTVKCGATHPGALQTYLKRGVRLYSCPQLHAKLYVFGRTLVIGSNNVSSNSSRVLGEAALETSNPGAVKDALRYLDGLDKIPLGPHELRELRKIYQEPKFAFAGATPRKKSPGVWLVPLALDEWDDDAKAAAKHERPRARQRLTSREFELQEFNWTGGRFAADIQAGARVLQVVIVNRTRTEVIRPGSVVSVRRYGIRGGTRIGAVVFIEVKRTKASLTLKQLKRSNQGLASTLRRLRGPKLSRAPEIRRALRALWPS